MMKKILAAALVLVSLLMAFSAFAEEAETALPEGVVKEYRWFVNQYKTVRGRTVTYYKDVYAYNHGDWGLTPFDSTVPAEYFVKDEEGTFAIAPVVLDVTDAMRTALYGGDHGETALYYGQYCDRIRGTANRVGFSGVHEGVDFKFEPGAPLFAMIGGEVTRAGDSNGTVAIYNAEMDVTLLYLHCEEIAVRRGDVVEAGQQVGVEGNKNSGSDYTHVEMRTGRHTTSNTYRDTKVESACPYPYMKKALNVTESGRQPQTAAAVAQAQRMREEAEAAARAEAEAQAAAEQEEAEETIELVDQLPGTKEGFGFGEETVNEETDAQDEVTNAAPEATLPPSNP